MPTGYTHEVQTGAITEFRDFAMRCARNFGALVTMRDDAPDAEIPAKFEPSTKFYDEMENSALVRLDWLNSASPSELDRKWRADQDEAAKQHANYKAQAELERGRYEAMLAKVDAWKPPTHEHTGLKKFMQDQLRESIRFDCDGCDELIKSERFADWFERSVRQARRDIDYAREERRKEIERTDARNKWIQDLRDSLR